MVAHGQGLVVKMFRDGDPAGVNALSARQNIRTGLGGTFQEGSSYLSMIIKA
jgi:hypothetical protein